MLILLAGAERDPLVLFPRDGPFLTRARLEEQPGALCRLLNSPSQVAISSVRNVIFSAVTMSSRCVTSSDVSSRGDGGKGMDLCSPSVSVIARAGTDESCCFCRRIIKRENHKPCKKNVLSEVKRKLGEAFTLEKYYISLVMLC